MDGDVEPAVAAGQSRVRQRIGQPLDQASRSPAVCLRPARSTGAITLTFTGAMNSAGPIAIKLNLLSGTSGEPFGVVDTPVDGSTGVTGAVPFTGWALDDVEVVAGDDLPRRRSGRRWRRSIRTARVGADLRRLPGVHRPRAARCRGGVSGDPAEYAGGMGFHGPDEHAAQPGERDVRVLHLGAGSRRQHRSCWGRERSRATTRTRPSRLARSIRRNRAAWRRAVRM